jgi:probable non-F420 flavinoid oxidoreductase
MAFVTRIGYHASHEQFTPSALRDYSCHAEQAGFAAVMSSDHFHPWSEVQGESGFSWAWLGAAMQATSVPFGVICAPAPRYHPALVAQAAATLAELFPDRFWLALGSGQALNEHITGERWPSKTERNARLLECVEVIRALWRGETVTNHGRVTVEDARLYTQPARPPLLLGAAVTAETAEWVGGWADGLLTISRPHDEQQAVVDAFRRGGGAGKPMYLKVQLSYAEDDSAARQGAFEQWRTNLFDSPVLADLRLPSQFEAAARFVRPEDLDRFVRISSEPRRHVAWLQADAAMGFDLLILHNVNRGQERFIAAFGEEVIPAVRSAS